MKSFADYLTESNKTYSFKIGLAGELPEGVADTLETALKKYGIENLTPGKKTPITERPLDFPQLQNTEVTYFEAELNYPTFPRALEEYLSWYTGVPHSHVIVRKPGEQQELYQEPEADGTYEAKLTSELEDVADSKESQQQVAGNRVMDLLQELEKARKERGNDPSNAATQTKENEQSTEENGKSPIGS